VSKINLQIDDRAIVTQINGSLEFRAYLLHCGISIGTILYQNYSPTYTGLVSITVNGKMLSLRKADFENLEIVKI